MADEPYDTQALEDQVLALVEAHASPEDAAQGALGALAAWLANLKGGRAAIETLYQLADDALVIENELGHG